MKKTSQIALLATAALAAAGLAIGGFSLDKKLKEAKLELRTALSAPISAPKTYAVIANGVNLKKYSEGNHALAILNNLSFYKAMKDKGLSDEDITLLSYNPKNLDAFKTREYKSILEGKVKGVSPSVVPKEGYPIQTDGEATKENFLNAIKGLNLTEKDTLYIILSSPAYAKNDLDKRVQNTRNQSMEIGSENLFNVELRNELMNKKYKKVIIIQNSGNSSNFLPYLNTSPVTQSIFLSEEQKRENGLKEVLAIASPNNGNQENNLFGMKLLSGKNEGLNNLVNGIEGAKTYYFNGIKEPLDQCAWYGNPLFN